MIYGPTVLFALGEGAVIPLIPIIAAQLGADVATAALVASALVVGQLCGNIPAGWAVARIGERLTMAIAGTLSLVGVVGHGLRSRARRVRGIRLPHRILRRGLRPRAPLVHDDARAARVPRTRAVAAGRHVPPRHVRRTVRRRGAARALRRRARRDLVLRRVPRRDRAARAARTRSREADRRRSRRRRATSDASPKTPARPSPARSRPPSASASSARCGGSGGCCRGSAWPRHPSPPSAPRGRSCCRCGASRSDSTRRRSRSSSASRARSTSRCSTRAGR